MNAIGSGRAYLGYGASSTVYGVLRVCLHPQLACLLSKQVIGKSIFTPSLLPLSLLSRAPFLSTLSWHE